MGEIRAIDEMLSVRSGRLFVEGCEVAELAGRFGTPLYVVSEDQLRRTYRRFRQAFESRWSEGPVHVLPSIKANFALALRRVLTEEGAGCDTFGAGEWLAARRSGALPELISVNGACKTDVLLQEAIDAGARITLDSGDELRRVRSLAARAGRRAKVRFRLRPRYSDLDAPSDFASEATAIRELALEYKPGIATDELVELGAEALTAPELDVTGVMAHLGRHSSDLEVWRRMVESVVETLAELSGRWGRWEPREIDLGGGFATSRDPTGRQTPRGRDRPASARAPSIEEYAEVITATLRTALRRVGLDPARKTLEVEPGRGLFADAGIHLATVRNLKRQRDPRPHQWVETDTTEMFLLDGLIEHNRWSTVFANRADAPATHRADIVGISCGFDEIVSAADVPDVAVGDVVAFLDTGAYQDACANNFNALPRPGTVLVHQTESEWIRRPETVEEVFGRDRVPIRLQVGRAAEAGA